MLKNECTWISRAVFAAPEDAVFPLLNLGSCSLAYRRQAFIWDDIERPALERGRKIVNVDLEPAEGVDIAGDILDRSLQLRLAALGCRSILCSNLLEHVEDAGAVAAAITGLLPPGGYAFVTVPYRFRHHPHPIDNGLRPTVEELAALFPRLALVRGKTVTCGREYRVDPWGWRQLLGALARVAVPVPLQEGRRAGAAKRLRALLGPVSATCVVLRRPGSTSA